MKDKIPSLGSRPRRTRSSTGALPSKRQKRMSQKKKEALGLETPSPIKKSKKEVKKKNYNLINGRKARSSNDSDDESSLNAETLACCVCRCTVDFSDRDFFSWTDHDCYDIISTDDDQSKDDDLSEDSDSENDERSLSAGGNTTNAPFSHQDEGNESMDLDRDESQSCGDHDEDSSLGSQFYGIKFPSSFHDSNNALLICDGCDRCFHQRCHFVPVLVVPRSDWYCLICQYEKHLLNNVKINSVGKLPIKVKNDQSGGILTKDILPTIENSLAPTRKDLDYIYRIPEGWNSKERNKSEIVTNLNEISNEPFTLQERFEFHSAKLKSEMLQKDTKKHLKAMINHQLSSIRMAQASIRAYISSSRSRKSLIEKYTSSKQLLPQEFAESVKRLAQCKLKIREVMQCLQNVIWNRNDRELMAKWIDCLQIDTSGRIISSLSNVNDGSIPEVISIQHNSSATENSKQSDQLMLKSDITAKVFVDNQVRIEPRFDIKDYDADEDDDNSSSADRAERIKCCVCFSGHTIPDENDILMCDGQGCFRSFHMKCCTPHVTQHMLDEDENGTWFCPLCVLFANALHYTETEFHATEADEFQYGNENDNQSSKSWENANDVFPESFEQLQVATKWKEGKRDTRSDSILSMFLGMEVSTIKEHKTNGDVKLESENMDDEDSDSEDDEFSDGDTHSTSNKSDHSDDISSVEWGIEKTELRALSGSESSDNEDEDVDIQVRRSRRLLKEKEFKAAIDSGKMDTANIVYGKRRRKKVDYCKLNDAMFSSADPKTIASVDDDEEYHFLQPKGKSSLDSDSSDETNSEDGESTNESELETDGVTMGSHEGENGLSSVELKKGNRASPRRNIKII